MHVSTDKLKALRADRGWSQEVLAKVSGLSVRTIQRVESDGKASSETLLSIASAFDATPKSLQATSDKIEVNWKKRQVMKNLFAFAVLAGAVFTLITLGIEWTFFVDVPSILFIVLFCYSAIIITFGTDQTIKSIKSLKYLFTDEMVGGSAAAHLATLFRSKIKFLYGGAFIAFIIGAISIHSYAQDNDAGLHMAYAVNLIVVFYAALISEAVFRPLSIKLETCDMPQ